MTKKKTKAQPTQGADTNSNSAQQTVPAAVQQARSTKTKPAEQVAPTLVICRNN